MSSVEIDLQDEEAMQLWIAVGHLASRLPGQWVLVGGLMVQLHAVEHGVTDVRPTRDIDILGQARPPGTLRSIDAALRDEGFEPLLPDLDGYAHRYERDGVIVDLLAPDGIKPPPDLGAGRRAIGIPGGSQALARSETVTVTVDGRTFELRRPTLLGALLVKARSLMVHDDPETQREDLLVLLALIGDPRQVGLELLKSERRWLRATEQRLNLSGISLLDAATMRRAELAYQLLVRDP
jgi:hypothetical protein